MDVSIDRLHPYVKYEDYDADTSFTVPMGEGDDEATVTDPDENAEYIPFDPQPLPLEDDRELDRPEPEVDQEPAEPEQRQQDPEPVEDVPPPAYDDLPPTPDPRDELEPIPEEDEEDPVTDAEDEETPEQLGRGHRAKREPKHLQDYV